MDILSFFATLVKCGALSGRRVELLISFCVVLPFAYVFLYAFHPAFAACDIFTRCAFAAVVAALSMALSLVAGWAAYKLLDDEFAPDVSDFTGPVVIAAFLFLLKADHLLPHWPPYACAMLFQSLLSGFLFLLGLLARLLRVISGYKVSEKEENHKGQN